MSALPEVGPLLEQMADQLSRYLKERQIDDPAFVGIHTGGVWIAEALHQQVAPNAPMGTLDIAFYRVHGRHLILVDDVLMTGRTIRAALNELFDYGRPASVTLVTLLDIEARQLPVRADILGASLALPAGQRVKLTGPSPLQLTLNAATH